MRIWLGFMILGGLLSALGCQSSRDEVISRETELNLQEADARTRELRTISGLAKLEASLSDYYKAEKHIPKALEDLIPKYLAEMPMAETGVRGHKDTTEVRIYGFDVLRGGQIDGSRLKDTGGWGYVYNDRQIVVFVDCTHKSSSGRPWYQERGVY
ncbi:MAG: hypothetical protein HY921_08865 [Elusimicrobia bacterium]|nr:hypothetical protein [Elusimicrobiota bacterium]